MKLDEVEKSIVVSERDHRTIEGKLNYVNERLGLKEDEQITKSSYYYKLHIMEKKIKGRAKVISRDRLINLVNEHDTLKDDRIQVGEMLKKAITDTKWMAAARLKIIQMQIGQRIASIAESIYYLQTDPKFHIEQIKIETEQEEELNDKIRLYANSSL